MAKNGAKAFVSYNEMTPVKVTVGVQEMFIYQSDEASVQEAIAGLFGQPTEKRAYRRRSVATKNENAVWPTAEEAKPRRRRRATEIATEAAPA